MNSETHAGATILLVDDVDEYRSLMRDTLARKGYRVKAAADEQEAVERARLARPDLILLELGWTPPLRTLEMGRRIREGSGVDGGVLIVVYADRADEVVDEGGEVGVGPNEYVILPENAEQFENFLGRLLAAR